MSLVAKHIPDINIHISTQSNMTNHIAIQTAAGMGASRVNLSRELSYSSLKNIIKNSHVEIEVFAHGALCISYSGRCMLSKYMAGRDANKGECAHSCRWKYYLMEEERSNLFFPIEQDGDRGTFIYNSRDLCLLPVLDKIVDSGVDSIKIEGRMKTESYVSLVTWVYRKALDLIKKGDFNKENIGFLTAELDKASHRNFTTGFLFAGDDKRELEENDNVGYIKIYSFIGTPDGWNDKLDEPVISVRNQFKKGDEIDIMMPGKMPEKRIADKIIDDHTLEEVPIANPNDRVIIKGLKGISPYSILRIKN
jgi:putative protease